MTKEEYKTAYDIFNEDVRRKHQEFTEAIKVVEKLKAIYEESALEKSNHFIGEKIVKDGKTYIVTETVMHKDRVFLRLNHLEKNGTASIIVAEVEIDITPEEKTEDGTMTAVCDECGKEFVVDEFNKNAPYNMCDDCYENYLCKN